MIFNLKKKEDKKIFRIYKKAYKNLKKFYEFKEDININVFVINNRDCINALRMKKTPKWVIGFSNPKINTIFILDRKKFSKESEHKYSKAKYERLITHEMSHIFFYRLMNDLKSPAWFSEGVALYTDGNTKVMERPKKFENFLKFYKPGSGMFKESGFVIELLIKRFGKKKLLGMIKKTKGVKNKKQFEKLFKKIYGFNLNCKNINKLLDK